MSDREGQFVLKIQLTHGRKTARKHWTLKAARHDAKSFCNNPTVERIVVSGPGIAPTIIFNAGEERPL